ncbi:TonB family protein [Pedobacter puniceum]|uniref:TonB family protein n=1 Tax=Pedobacter puniceum TaxID=2666136 RepID=A0A7K0FL34_9SPHI|nr:TonB family protein [Pedobacter puniceum]MRX46668.1 TonB family protein [Pedobacter puniceum]
MKKQLFTLFLFLINSIAFAQVDKNADLYKIILTKDSLLFDVGFNTCNIQQFENLLSDSLKLYHDKDGISNKTKFLYDLKNGLCKNPETRQVRRFLVKESTQIFPLYKNGILYGAIHNGVHIFSEKGESQKGIAKFTNMWLLENGNWKLTTSFSFDHQAYQNKRVEKPVFVNEIEEIKQTLESYPVNPQDSISFINPEKAPEFKGGNEGYQAYIKQNIKVPEEVVIGKVKGKVVLSFIVEKNGSVSNVKVLRKLSKACDEEAVRLIKNCPKFIPGEIYGKPAKFAYSFAVVFDNIYE